MSLTRFGGFLPSVLSLVRLEDVLSLWLPLLAQTIVGDNVFSLAPINENGTVVEVYKIYYQNKNHILIKNLYLFENEAIIK